MRITLANFLEVATGFIVAFQAPFLYDIGWISKMGVFGIGLNLQYVVASKTTHHQELHKNKLLPIVYRKEYNIGFWGIEKLHPFDSKKWGRVFYRLQEHGIIESGKDIYTPEIVPDRIINEYLKSSYLEALKTSAKVASVVEIFPLAIIPNFLLQNSLLKAMRFQVGGTILAAKLALEYGWAINIGGGFHHASCHNGGGFCVYPDIYIAIQEERKKKPDLRALIIDMDAHQGNGHERDFIDDKQTKILDIYNQDIYPYIPDNHPLTSRIDFKFPIPSYTSTEKYLDKVKEALSQAISQAEDEKYDLILYNAGTDILAGDPLGRLNVSPDGVIQRDELVFRAAIENNIPILMVTSGGYLPNSYKVIGDSIINLSRKGLLSRG